MKGFLERQAHAMFFIFIIIIIIHVQLSMVHVIEEPIQAQSFQRSSIEEVQRGDIVQMKRRASMGSLTEFVRKHRFLLFLSGIANDWRDRSGQSAPRPK